MFILFINDLPESLQNSATLLYADDAKIYKIVNSPPEARSLQKDLDRLRAWAIRNGIRINLSKCNVISFFRRTSAFDVEYPIDSEVLQSMDSIRDLGVIYDKWFSLEKQIKAVTTKCVRFLVFTHNVTCYFRSPQSPVVYLYKSLVLPILSYCSPAWLPHTGTALSKLVAIEVKVLRLGSKKTAHLMHFFDHDYTPIRQTLGLPKLETFLTKQDCTVSYEKLLKVHLVQLK